jgi:hypothetical protein
MVTLADRLMRRCMNLMELPSINMVRRVGMILGNVMSKLRIK